MVDSKHRLLQAYEPPVWATGMKNIPGYYVKLAQRNTPVTEWKLQHVPNGFKIGIKRDDMTGSTLTGSKVRKLEFLLGEALLLNCDTVITEGSALSNHCRSTAIAAKELGLKCHLFIYREKEDVFNDRYHGNMLLINLMGSDVIMTDCRSDKLRKEIEELSDQLRTTNNSSVYVMDNGGSSYVGMFGYITCFQELIEQNVLEDYTDIFVTTGSTGTAAGIAIANYLTGSKLKIHAVSVSRDKDLVHLGIQHELKNAGLENVRADDILDVMMGYCDKGYGLSTKEEMEDIIRIAQTTGVILDPVYTVKTVRRMLVEMKDNPNRFKGKKVLFIHTGGLFNVFNGSMASYLNDIQQST